MGCCCSHPTVTLEYTFDTDPKTLYQELFNASKAHHMMMDSHDDDHNHLVIIFQTPKCGWLDMIDVRVSGEKGQAVAYITSSSTNLCPGWCCDCCRFCCNYTYRWYSDNHQNQLHIRQLIEGTARKPANKRIVDHSCCAVVLTRWL